jgi:ABC-type multidrug transport system fused ATPase/permease subunit
MRTCGNFMSCSNVPHSYAWYINQCWNSPLVIVLVMALLFDTLGSAAFAGFAALLLLLALQTFCGVYLQEMRKRVQQHTDVRVGSICDALGGIRTLKMMVAEYTMQNMIGRARAREVSFIMRWSFIQAAVAGVYSVAAPCPCIILLFFEMFCYYSSSPSLHRLFSSPSMLRLPLCRLHLSPRAGMWRLARCIIR